MRTKTFLKDHLKWLKGNLETETRLGLTKLSKLSTKDIRKTERQIKRYSK